MDYRPMYPNFPAQVMKMDESELYINAIIHYLSFGSLKPVYEKEERLPLFDTVKLKVIELGNIDDFNEIFINIMGSKTSISDTDKMDMEWFIKMHKEDYQSYLPDEIPLKENVCFLCNLLLKHTTANSIAISKYISTATDVLRLAVSLSDGDISLASNTKFKSFNRKERRLLLGLLDNCNNIEEDMVRYKSQWIRLGERLHPSEYKMYFKAQGAFNQIRNNEQINTFNSRIDYAIKSKDLSNTVSLLSERPGELPENLSYLKETEEWDLLKESLKQCQRCINSSLLQVIEHFKWRNEKNSLRTFFPKGNVAKVYGIDNNLSYLNDEICRSVIAICEESLTKRFCQRENLGKVFLDERLKDYIVPFSQRSASKALKTFVRGTKISISENIKTIRSFLYWKENMDDRADLDLSAVLYDADWNYLEHISYTNLKSEKYKAAHSGDITSAPNGASEFIDLDIESIKKFGGRYVVFAVYSFTGQKFVELPECFVGWMERECPASGEIYEPKTVENKIDISSESLICIPMILDFYENKVIWADVSLKSQPTWNNLENNKKGMVLMGKALTTLRKPNLYDLFLLHSIRGLCSNGTENRNK